MCSSITLFLLFTSCLADMNSDVEEKIAKILKLDCDSDMECANKGLVSWICSSLFIYS